MQDVAQKKMSLEEMLECARMFKSSAGKIICQYIYQKKFYRNDTVYLYFKMAHSFSYIVVVIPYYCQDMDQRKSNEYLNLIKEMWKVISEQKSASIQNVKEYCPMIDEDPLRILVMIKGVLPSS